MQHNHNKEKKEAKAVYQSRRILRQGSPFRDSIGDLLIDTLSYQVKSVKSSEKLLWEMFVSLFVV